jgi:trimethylamine--corrinoid protein Co-methyltransferase
MAGYGGTDAETAATWQTGTEVTYDLAMAALDEAELMAGLGLVDTFRAFSLEKLLLDDDVYHLVRHALLDLPPGDLDEVLDVVHAVGPGGSYLGQRHTRAHLRDVTTLTIAQQHDEHGRRRDAAEVARERGLRILAEYEPAPLPDDVRSALTSILARADEDEGTR